MSGGVDSSVAALLLKQQGFDVVGVTFHLFDKEDESVCIENGDAKTIEEKLKERYRSCCDISTARQTAENLGIEHRVLFLDEDFEKSVINPFIESYANGSTPNPCVLCNPLIKWAPLMKLADEIECPFVATGHFARIEDGFISRGKFNEKDQAYFLYRIPKAFAVRTLFPLGELSKNDVRKIASDAGLQSAKRPESHEVCFFPKGGLRDFLIKAGVEDRAGVIADINGKILGEHSGWRVFTIGQRRGLNVASNEGRLYVVRIVPVENRIVLGPKSVIMNSRFTTSGSLFHIGWKIGEEKILLVQIRHSAPAVQAKIIRTGENETEISLEKRVFAPTKGQSAVFFDNEKVVGGGIIAEVVE
jgi:tRNA-uridine 2-sulfurtransferase